MTSEELLAIAQDWEAGGSIHDALVWAAGEIKSLQRQLADAHESLNCSEALRRHDVAELKRKLTCGCGDGFWEGSKCPNCVSELESSRDALRQRVQELERMLRI